MAEESTCPGTTEGTIEPSTADIDVCQDNGNDCCANEPGGEPESCADGYSPSAQPTSWDDCPNYECVPDATCVEPTEQRDVLCCMLGAYDERGSFNASLADDGWNCPDEDIRDDRARRSVCHHLFLDHMLLVLLSKQEQQHRPLEWPAGPVVRAGCNGAGCADADRPAAVSRGHGAQPERKENAPEKRTFASQARVM